MKRKPTNQFPLADYDIDILVHLRKQTCVPTVLLCVKDGVAALIQAIARAADEIERLREENKSLRTIIRSLKS